MHFVFVFVCVFVCEFVCVQQQQPARANLRFTVGQALDAGDGTFKDYVEPLCDCTHTPNDMHLGRSNAGVSTTTIHRDRDKRQ